MWLIAGVILILGGGCVLYGLYLTAHAERAEGVWTQMQHDEAYCCYGCGFTYQTLSDVDLWEGPSLVTVKMCRHCQKEQQKDALKA